jgi:membrane protein CcdC involved in cytochrome C biogenesis
LHLHIKYSSLLHEAAQITYKELEVKRKKCRAYNTIDNGLLIIAPVLDYLLSKYKYLPGPIYFPLFITAL